MIAHIIPLKRMPMKMGYFDYAIPEGMKVEVGQLVEIPFRSSSILGCVSGTTDTSIHKGKLKPITRLLNQTPFLSGRAVKFANEVARVYGVAPSVIITMMLPSLQKRSLTKVELLPIKHNTKSGSKKVVRYTDVKSYHKMIKEEIKKATGQILILVPQITQLLEMRHLHFSAVSWESTMSVKEKREAWLKVRNGEQVVIGTRSAAFLPLYNLEKVIVIDEEWQDHKSWDQAPRYRVHDIAERLGADVTYFSRTPKFTTINSVSKKNLSQIGKRKPTNITIANMTKERGAGNYEIISSTLDRHMHESIEKEESVFLFINKKGFAQMLRCRDCGYIFSCVSCFLPYTLGDNKALCRHCKSAVEVPTNCHKCSGITLRYQGAGIQQIAHWAGKQFGDKVHVIEWTADEKQKNITLDKPLIIIGTTAAIPYIHDFGVTLFGVVDADHILNIPEYNAAERGLALFATMNGIAQSNDGSFIIQTHAPDHAVFEALISGKLQPFLKSENAVRKHLKYPPHSKLMKISLEAPQAIATMNKLVQTISQNLKGIEVMSYPLLPETRGKNKRYAVLCKLDPNAWWKQAQEITPLLKQGMKVDIDPNSLLS